MSGSGPAALPPGPSLAEVLRLGLEMARPKLPTAHWKVLRALLACRTPALGGHRYWCQDCDQSHFVPHSCRNRHCPLCQGQAARAWLQAQQSALLPIPYFHLVFTLPHLLNPLIRQNQRALYKLLFEAASATLLEFGQNRFGAQLGVTAVLHTWSQTLLDHYHLHCIVTGGGLSRDGARWVSAPRYYLFPVEALSLVFRAKFCAGLLELFGGSRLVFHGQSAPLAQAAPFGSLISQARSRPWNVYAKRPFGGPEQVLGYLSRYTHRVAISPGRLLSLDRANHKVSFTWKDYAQGARRKIMSLEVGEFVRRFCLHLLPERLVKIRHYGLLGNRQRQTRLAQARALLLPPTLVFALLLLGESAGPLAEPPPRVCPFCGSPRLWLTQIVPPHCQARPPPQSSCP